MERTDIQQYLSKILDWEREMEQDGFALIRTMEELDGQTLMMSTQLEKLKILQEQYALAVKDKMLSGLNSSTLHVATVPEVRSLPMSDDRSRSKDLKFAATQTESVITHDNTMAWRSEDLLLRKNDVPFMSFTTNSSISNNHEVVRPQNAEKNEKMYSNVGRLKMNNSSNEQNTVLSPNLLQTVSSNEIQKPAEVQTHTESAIDEDFLNDQRTVMTVHNHNNVRYLPFVQNSSSNVDAGKFLQTSQKDSFVAETNTSDDIQATKTSCDMPSDKLKNVPNVQPSNIASGLDSLEVPEQDISIVGVESEQRIQHNISAVIENNELLVQDEKETFIPTGEPHMEQEVLNKNPQCENNEVLSEAEFHAEAGEQSDYLKIDIQEQKVSDPSKQDVNLKVDFKNEKSSTLKSTLRKSTNSKKVVIEEKIKDNKRNEQNVSVKKTEGVKAHSSHGQGSSTGTDSEESFFDRGLSLTSSAAYKSLIGAGPSMLPSQQEVASDSNSEDDDVEKALAVAVEEKSAVISSVREPQEKKTSLASPAKVAKTTNKNSDNQRTAENSNHTVKASRTRASLTSKFHLSEASRRALGLESDLDDNQPNVTGDQGRESSDEFDFYD